MSGVIQEAVSYWMIRVTSLSIFSFCIFVVSQVLGKHCKIYIGEDK